MESKKKCALCNEREANKKNTHYLTDAIIRTCLNQGGSNEREKGLYFDLSTNKSGVEYNFQRATNVEAIEDNLGRELSDDEIGKARDLLFSVDFVFCEDCERLFGEIENPFIASILPLFREGDLYNFSSLNEEKELLLRIFFLLQVWRLSVCDPCFSFRGETKSYLQGLVIDHNSLSLDDLRRVPLFVTYLETKGGPEEYSKNVVGFAIGGDPGIVFMNDFVVQVFEMGVKIEMPEYCGLNSAEGIINSFGEKEKWLTIKADSERKEILKKVQAPKVLQTENEARVEFEKQWVNSFRRDASGGIFGSSGIHMLTMDNDRTTNMMRRVFLMPFIATSNLWRITLSEIPSI